MNTVTNTFQDRGKCVKEITQGEDGLLRFAAADTFAEGTILGRLATSAATYTGVITGTGTRVATITARSGASMLPGVYTLLAGTLTSGVGIWTMTAPDGRTATYTTGSAGADMTFPALGVDVVIADTGTNFVTADSIAFTAVASTVPVYAPWALNGANGLQEAVSVLHFDAVATELEDQSFKAMTAGFCDGSRLVVDGGGAVPKSAIYQLHKNGIFAPATQEMSVTEGTEY